MKRITAMLLSLLLGAGLLTVCWRGTEYHREDTERENGVTLYVRRDRQAAFAGARSGSRISCRAEAARRSP